MNLPEKEVSDNLIWKILCFNFGWSVSYWKRAGNSDQKIDRNDKIDRYVRLIERLDVKGCNVFSCCY